MGGMNNARPTSIYIVDDSAAIRSRLADLLGRIDGVHLVGEAADAPKAVADILALRPDSVLLDLNLGGTNGMQVLRMVHPLHPDIAFVVLTNHAEPQYRRACERAGAAYFLDKSTEFDRVAAVIAEIAATHH
jgi:DNA-binding NarL/FixJ family response regulator